MIKEQAIVVQGVSKKYGKYTALEEINLEIYEGEIFGLLGPNGAGKSTLSKIMSGIVKPDSGKIFFYGKELGKNYASLKKIFSVVPQDISLYRSFTVIQNMDFFGSLYSINSRELRERKEYLLKLLNLEKFRNKKAEELSGGYQRMLNVACSLINDPKIIFMDEPTVGLDPTMRELLWEKIDYLKNSGKTICVTTHYMEEAQKFCSRVGIISGGKVLMTGTPQKLINYFGGIKVLVLSLDKKPEKEMLEALMQVFKGMEPASSGNNLIIPLQKQESMEEFSAIVDWLKEEGFAIKSWIVKEPDLEDVFMNIAGRKLSD